MSSFPADRPDLPRRTDGTNARTLPVVKVVLLSDPAQDLVYVVRTVMQITRFPREEATHKMWQAHHGGQAVLLMTYVERAEFIAEQFKEKGLNVVLEPA